MFTLTRRLSLCVYSQLNILLLPSMTLGLSHAMLLYFFSAAFLEEDHVPAVSPTSKLRVLPRTKLGVLSIELSFLVRLLIQRLEDLPHVLRTFLYELAGTERCLYNSVHIPATLQVHVCKTTRRFPNSALRLEMVFGFKLPAFGACALVGVDMAVFRCNQLKQTTKLI